MQHLGPQNRAEVRHKWWMAFELILCTEMDVEWFAWFTVGCSNLLGRSEWHPVSHESLAQKIHYEILYFQEQVLQNYQIKSRISVLRYILRYTNILCERDAILRYWKTWTLREKSWFHWTQWQNSWLQWDQNFILTLYWLYLTN